jgi:hypothetical protein
MRSKIRQQLRSTIMIYMWQESPRKRHSKEKPYFRFQTDNIAAAEMMKSIESFKLVGYGSNCPLWIFRAQFKRPDIAQKVLKLLAGSKVNYDAREEVYSAKVIESMLD